MVLTIVGRVWLADSGPLAWAVAVVSGILLALLYWRSRQLAPIIVGHVIATIVITPAPCTEPAS